MTDPNTASPPDLPPLPARLTMLALACVALAISAMLLAIALRAGAEALLPGCGPGGGSFDCESVMGSLWSRWLGLPVSAPAVAVDCVALGLLTMLRAPVPARDRRLAWLGLVAVAAVLLGAGAWFVLVQAVILHKYCPYCLAAHAAGAGLGVMILCYVPIRGGQAVIAPRTLAVPLLVAGLGLAVLIGGRFVRQPETSFVEHLVPAAPFDTGPGPQRLLSILNGQVGLRPHDYPIMGSPDAPHILVCLFDYACPHCRKLHPELQDAIARYGGQVAFVMLPAPLNPACNSAVKALDDRFKESCGLARLGVAVWYADKEKSPRFDQWLFTPEDPPSLQAATAEAARLLGRDALARAMRDPRVDVALRAGVTLYAGTDAGRIPKILGGTFLAISRPSAEDLDHLLETELNIEPVTTAPASGPATMP